MNDLTDPHLIDFVAGFDLAGRRMPDGKLHTYHGDSELTLDDWPAEITFGAVTYTLENVVKGVNGYESGVYC